MKPLARWTIGPTSQQGILCLKKSILFFKKVYPEFDRIICYNNISKPAIDELMLKQSSDCLPIVPLEDNWKFYPPKISNANELFIDNDLIILERIKEIDEFINGNFLLVTEGLRKNFGQFNVDRSPLNTGLIGIPADFNLKNEITNNVKRWESRFDNQGLVALFSQKKETKVIDKNTISLYLPDSNFKRNSKGHHFLRLNTDIYHKAWNEFQELEKFLLP